MKRFISLFASFFLLLPFVSAQVNEFNVEGIINQNGTTSFHFSLSTEGVKRIRIPFSFPLSDVREVNAECKLEKNGRNVLDCLPEGKNFEVYFLAENLIEKKEIDSFHFEFPSLWEIKDLSLTVKLPEGMGFSSKVMLPIWPSSASVGSDGRRIFANWKFEDVKPGDTIAVRVYYEYVVPPPPGLDYRWFILPALIILIVGILVYREVSKKSKLILSVLNENERRVVEIIKGGVVDQRKIVKLSGFSKAKVSRIIQSLESRGIVKVERIGRRNKVTLKKK